MHHIFSDLKQVQDDQRAAALFKPLAPSLNEGFANELFEFATYSIKANKPSLCRLILGCSSPTQAQMNQLLTVAVFSECDVVKALLEKGA